ncbi:MAG: septation protein IspZ [Rickettsiales bacterium]|nr:MAG: septation protein IspZ [Rickettsiales bacterium]
MLKFLTEFSPLVAFFVGYKMGGILDATLYMLILSIICIIITYVVEKKINKVNLVSTILIVCSASLTLISGNPIFIKIKATILYILFSIVFLVTSYKYTPVIKYVLGTTIIFHDEQKWNELNMRFMWFFLAMAFMNEIMWRNFSEQAWVNFKVFGAIPIMIIFILAQMPFLFRNKIDDPAID